MQRVRIPSNLGTSSAAADIDEEGRDSGGASAAATRGRAITLAVRKGLIQNSIPIGYLKVITAPSYALSWNTSESFSRTTRMRTMTYWLLISSFKKNSSMTCNSMNSAKEKSRLLPKCENQAAISCLMFLRLLVENMRRISSPISQKDNSKLASAMADAAAATTTCSVLRELNKGASTPPLSSLSVPKLIR